MESPQLDYPNGKRIMAGVGWGSLWGGGLCGILLSIVPVGPAGFFLAIMVLAAAISVGISLNWQAARGHCEACDTILTATPSGGKCSGCGQKYRASNRQLVKMS